jgi:Zn-dependent protease
VAACSKIGQQSNYSKFLSLSSQVRYDKSHMDPLQIAMILILIMSVVIHEMAHGYAANWLGDPTARLQGRLSPNPLVHLDPLMSVILPGLLIMSGSPFLFGAAKPVPYNPYNFTNQKWGEAIVAVAGPASNIVLALIFAVIVRFADVLALSESVVFLAFQVIVLNLFLAFFNLVPIPPLDGSKILPKFLPLGLRMSYERFRSFLEQNVFLAFGLVIFTFIMFLGAPLYRFTISIAYALIG